MVWQIKLLIPLKIKLDDPTWIHHISIISPCKPILNISHYIPLLEHHSMALLAH